MIDIHTDPIQENILSQGKGVNKSSLSASLLMCHLQVFTNLLTNPGYTSMTLAGGQVSRREYHLL